MIINGQLITNEEDLEKAILELDEPAHDVMRAMFRSIPLVQQQRQNIFGKQLSDKLVDLVGGKNIGLSKQGIVVNVSGLLQTLGIVKSLLDTGALKTASSIMAYHRTNTNYLKYRDVFDTGINDINTFLTENNYL